MRDITIVGAGLVGALWAYLLKKRGYNVCVYEKRADPRLESALSGRSINLVITSRGLNALNVAGLLDLVLPLTVPVYGRNIHPLSGPAFFQAYGRDRSECNYSVSRAELNKALIQQSEAAGVKFFFEHDIEDLNPTEKRVQFKTPTETFSHNYDLLFAADGAGSKIRRQLAQKFSDEFSEHTEWLDAGYKELFMPACDLETNALHIWPRGTHMLMGLANIDKSFTMTLYLPKHGQFNSLDHLKAEARITEFFETEFATAIQRMPDYLKDFTTHPEGALGTVRLNKWIFKDSIALLGDAAHAIVPFFGQGMNLGFEDCTILLKILDQYGGDWSKTLPEYENRQKPNSDAIAEMALENFVEMRDKVSDTGFQYRKKIESLIEQKFPDLYRSRYGMITYTLIPYSVAREAGIRQSNWLDKLATKYPDLSLIDMNDVQEYLTQDFNPWLAAKGFSTQKFCVSI